MSFGIDSAVGELKDKPIPFGPSSIENVDKAMLNYLNDLTLFTSTKGGFQKTPVIWVSPERSFSSKREESFRDKDGTLILPIVSLERTELVKDPTRKGSAWANILPDKDEKGGVIQISRRIKQDKTSNFANRDAMRRRGQLNFPGMQNRKIVYESITIPLPIYVDVTYKIVLRTEYQQQMNELVTPFITTPGAVNYILVKSEGHRYEGFIQQSFSQENNFVSFTSEERKLETAIEIKVLAYLIGEGKNQKQPKFAIRENAVEIKIPRERIVFQDDPEHERGRFYGLAGVVKEITKKQIPSRFNFSGNTKPVPATSSRVKEGGNVMTTDNYIARTTFNQSPSGTRTTFTTQHTFVVGTEMVFRDGLLMTVGSDFDYTVDDNGTTIEFTEAPGPNENLLISYVISSGS
tara:strand:- start:197 stop:1414 length:1218 start_codon:yes stop_codon:yes gene_type:complete